MPGFSETNAEISSVSINTTIPTLTIDWSTADYNVLGYRVKDNEWPSGTISVVALGSGVKVSGNVGSPWGYISLTYMDNAESLVTFAPEDVLKEMPEPNNYLELIQLNYDSTPSAAFHFTVECDWEELDPVTSKAVIPPNEGTDVMVYHYTVRNDWTGNKANLNLIMEEKKIYDSGQDMPDASSFGNGAYGLGTFGA